MTDLYFPCPFCSGVEGCDHTEPERKEAYTRLKFHAELGKQVIRVIDCMRDLDGPNDAVHQANKLVEFTDPIFNEEFLRRDKIAKEYYATRKEKK